jgi:amino acid transporter
MVIAFGGALALGWVFAQYGRRYAGAGTVYEYLAVGPRTLAVAAAGAYFLVALIGAAGGLVMGLLVQSFCTQWLGFDPGWWAGGAAVLALVVALLYLGIRVSAQWVLGLSLLAVVPLLVLTAAILLDGGASGHTLRAFDPGEGAVVESLLYAVLLFMGFESAACLGEESRRPHSTIPRGMLLAIVACGVFYVVVIYAATIGFGVDRAAAEWGSDPVAVIGLGDRYVGEPLSALINLAVLVDLAAFMIAVMGGAARGYYALARDGTLPRALAHVSSRGTPTGGIALIAGANLALMLVAIPFENRFAVFEAVFAAGPVISLSVYLALCVLAIPLVGGLGRAALVLGAAVPALGLYGSLVPFPEGPRLVGLALAGGCALAAAAWALWLRAHRAEQVAAAGALAERA